MDQFKTSVCLFHVAEEGELEDGQLAPPAYVPSAELFGEVLEASLELQAWLKKAVQIGARTGLPWSLKAAFCCH